MKGVLTGLVILLAATALAAQALPPTGDIVIIPERNTSNVSIVRSMGAATLDQFIGTIAVGPNPVDGVCIDTLGEFWVTVEGNDAIRIIDKFTLTVKDTIDTADIPNFGFPRGIIRTLDDQFVFVCARDLADGSSTVFKIQTATRMLVATFDTGYIPVSGSVPADDVALRPSDGSGAGTGDERLYVTVLASVAGDGRVFGFNLTTNTSMGGVVVTNPRQIDVTGDLLTVYVSFADGISPPSYKRISANTDTITATNVDTTMPVSAFPQVTAGIVTKKQLPDRMWVSGDGDGGTFHLEQFTGGASDGVIFLGANVGASRLSFNAGENKVYVGSNGGVGAAQMEVINVTAWPGTSLGTISGLGQGAHVAIHCSPNPAPFIADACPNFGAPAGGTVVEIQGGSFAPNAQWFVVTGGGPVSVPVSWQSSNQVFMTMPAGAGTVAFRIRNPDGSQDDLEEWFTYSSTPNSYTFTATPGLRARDYRMFSCPLFKTTDAVRQGIFQGFGPYNISVYRVFTWASQLGRYIEIFNWPSNSCGAGRSFWLLARFGGTATVSGNHTNDVGGTRFIGIILNPGWNQVSTPFINPTPLGIIVAGQTFNSATPVGPLNSVGINNFYFWDPVTPGYFIETGALQPGDGYFTFNPNPFAVFLWIENPLPKPGQLPPPSVLVQMAPGDPEPPPPPGDIGADGGGGGGGGCSARGDGSGVPFHWIAILLCLGVARIFARRG